MNSNFIVSKSCIPNIPFFNWIFALFGIGRMPDVAPQENVSYAKK